MPGKSSREDRNEGTMDRAKGRMKEAGGGVTGDKDKKSEGRSDQRKAKAKDKKAAAKDLLKPRTCSSNASESSRARRTGPGNRCCAPYPGETRRGRRRGAARFNGRDRVVQEARGQQAGSRGASARVPGLIFPPRRTCRGRVRRFRPAGEREKTG